MLGLAVFGAADADQLHFLELVLADETARVLTRRTRLAAEAQCVRGHAHGLWQVGQDFARDRRGQADFGCGDEPAVVSGPETVLGKLGQLVGAVHRIIVDQHRWVAFGVAVLAHLPVEHELRDGAVEAGHMAAQEGEACAGKLRTGLEIHAEGRAEIGMLLRLEIEGARVAPAAHFDIAFLVLALRHIGGGQVGDGCEHMLKLAAQLAVLFFQFGQALLQSGYLGLERFCLVAIALAHRLPDRLGRLVAAALRLLHLGGHFAALCIERKDGPSRCRETAPCEGCVESFGIVSDRTDIVHGQRLCTTACTISSG